MKMPKELDNVIQGGGEEYGRRQSYRLRSNIQQSHNRNSIHFIAYKANRCSRRNCRRGLGIVP